MGGDRIRKSALSHVEVFPATPDQEPVLANLLELYSHDFSEIVDVKIGKDGRFGYQPLSLYWKDPHRFPLLVTVDGDLAGFALVCKGSVISGDAGIWDLAEFFIMRGYRRCGAGTTAAHKVWRRFKGRWEVRVTERNHAAREFWKRAVTEFTAVPAVPTSFERAGKKWHVFSFVSDARN